MPVKQMAHQLATVMQNATQSYGSRPFGVGFLLCGYDTAGTHLFEIQPSAHYTEMTCAGIGARSQMARTYLERHLDAFAEADKNELVQHAIMALAESLNQDKSLTIDNTSIAIVGEGLPFTLYEGESIREWLAMAEAADEETSNEADAEEATAAAAAGGAATNDTGADNRMEVDS